MRRLARSIEALAAKDAERIRETERVAQLRRSAAAELHSVCAGFVDAINRLLATPVVELGPPEYHAESFRDPGANVIQINFGGRVIHLEFRATDTLSSTERFRDPYILEGAIRCFNQQLLDRMMIPETLLFCCLEKDRPAWVTFDPRVHRVAPFNREFLIAVMKKLV